ncbi:hypothetical protein C943_01943 [Mariniradius saccharolyticus AK6]|uniref:Uncharacterized protein n=1 Tax=Mariniradius saccharolyticus AK6 TaxID=1239962 RepID=M7XT32_9BACT|nr:hypothetical protein C943_01943 [Mariniradius saccharolyticus AK6]
MFLPGIRRILGESWSGSILFPLIVRELAASDTLGIMLIEKVENGTSIL